MGWRSAARPAIPSSSSPVNPTRCIPKVVAFKEVAAAGLCLINALTLSDQGLRIMGCGGFAGGIRGIAQGATLIP